MKIQVKEESNKFEPIELTLTIESEEELCDLWHRFNASVYDIDKESVDYLKHKSITLYDKWEVIDDLVKQRNLYK